MTDRSSTSHDDQWYADGLRFTCTQCGNCCTGPAGYVWITDDDVAQMAKHFKLDQPTFVDRYARKVRGRWSLVEHKTEHGYDCIFLDRKSEPGKALCSIYDARPAQCRTWPFWPENLTTPQAWEDVKRQTPCPGMDSGRLVPVTQIRIMRDATPE